MDLRRPRLALVVLAAAAALSPARASAWGFTAHRLVNEKAIETLPEPLLSFFRRNADHVIEHAVDPDLWRAVGQDKEPNHFLDMDAFGPPSAGLIPKDEAEHLRRHGPDAAAKGRLPWRIGEAYRDLVAAFREGRAAAHPGPRRRAGSLRGRRPRAAARGAELRRPAHRPDRPSQPVGEQPGGALRAPAPGGDGARGPRARWATRSSSPSTSSSESFELSLQSLASDKESTEGTDLADTPLDDRYGDAYYSRMYERERATVRSRLAASSAVVGSLWLTAWQEAGRPPLDGSFRFPYVRGRTKAVLVTLDGAGASVVADAVARGVMPRLGRLRAEGATADGSLTSLPAKTAPGHAAIFTGAWPDVNGIAGNRVAVPGGRVTEEDTGYTSTHLRAEPIWVTAAREGLRASVVSAPQIYPFAPYQRERRFGGNFDRGLTLIEGYQNYEVPDAVYTAAELRPRAAAGWIHELPAHDGEALEVQLTVAGSRVDGLLYDDPADAARGLDTLYLGLDKDTQGGVTLKPAPARGMDASAFAGLTVRFGGTQAAAYFRLFELSADGSSILLYRTSVHPLRASRPRIEEPAFAATGGFVGGWAGRTYEDGDLGPVLWEGGDGTAERRYLETVALCIRQFTRLTDFAMDRTGWDLLVTYLPFPDGSLHVWLGRLDPSLAGHDPALARRLRPLLDEVLAAADAFVGHVADRAGAETLIAVGADHGMGGVDRIVNPNVALRRAGLLAVDARGRDRPRAHARRLLHRQLGLRPHQPGRPRGRRREARGGGRGPARGGVGAPGHPRSAHGAVARHGRGRSPPGEGARSGHRRSRGRGPVPLAPPRLRPLGRRLAATSWRASPRGACTA